jgi:hypothetical protein
LEDAQGTIVDLEEMLDELEDNESDPFESSLMNMLSGMMTKTPESLGGGDVMTALMKIKSVSPESEQLLIKLGNLAESNPDQLKGFITQINSNL